MNRLAGTILTLLALAGGASAQTAPPAGQRGTPPGGSPQQAPGGTIHGSVVDAATGRPVAAASVGIRSAQGSALVGGAVARPDGTFRVEGLRPGRYQVRVSVMGYTAVTRADVAVSPASPVVDLGAIRLTAGAVALEGLTATGERSAVQLAPDRNTYQARDVATGAANATDVLRNVPSVEVDGDGKVSLRGNQNVAVQINGRAAPVTGDQLANFLQQLPAATVERVEVIPNPSAKYDPEGMAGILNIVLKQNTDLGTSGGVMLGVGSSNRVGDGINASGNLGWQKGPLTLFGSYGLNMGERETTGFHLLDSHPTTSQRSFLQQDILGEHQMRGHVFNGNADLKVAERTNVTGTLMLSARNMEMDSRTGYRQMDADRQLVGMYGRSSLTEIRDLTADGSLAFKRVFTPRQNELTAEVRLNLGRFEAGNDFARQDLTLSGGAAGDQPVLERADQDADTRNLTLQTDWTRSLGARTKLETGYKGTLRLLDGDLTADDFSYAENRWIRDAGQTNSARYGENVHAVYGVLSQGFGTVDVQAGLRAERADTRVELATVATPFDNDYTSLFPSALVAWNVSDTRQVKASYSKRVRRPDGRILNPFPFYEDPQNVMVGNPYLKPEYTHAVELGFQQSMQRGSLQISPYFRRTTDAIRRIRTVEDNVTTSTFKNLATSDSYGADLTGSLRLGDKLSGFASMNVFHTQTDGSNVGVSTEATSWSARLNGTYKVAPRTDLQGMWMYRAPQNVEGGRIESWNMLNFSIRQRLMGEKASLTLRVMDPFDQMGFAVRTGDATYSQESRRKWGARSAQVTFSYNFGRPPRVRPQPQQQQPDVDPSQPSY